MGRQTTFVITKKDGAIDQYLSEPDRSEGHALNKGFLLARGKLIKNISDDDVYDWCAIQASRRFLEAHPDIPVLSGMAADWNVCEPAKIKVQPYIADFSRNRPNGRFFFNCLPLMIRRSALSETGLFHTAMVSVDLEFSLRVTGFLKIAYLNRPCVVRIYNPQSIGRIRHQRVLKEIKELHRYYSLPSPRSYPARFKSFINPRNIARAALRRFRSTSKAIPHSVPDIFKKAELWLQDQHCRSTDDAIVIHDPQMISERPTGHLMRSR